MDVGKARFVGFSWPDADARTEDTKVSMRARTAAGWPAWREVEQAGDGPDATSSEYRAGRAYSAAPTRLAIAMSAVLAAASVALVRS